MIYGVILANKHTHIVDCNFSAPVSRTHEKKMCTLPRKHHVDVGACFPFLVFFSAESKIQIQKVHMNFMCIVAIFLTFSFQKGQMLFCNKTLILKHTAQRYTPTIYDKQQAYIITQCT